MKPSPPPAPRLSFWLLAGSLALNAVLVALYVVQSFSADESPARTVLVAGGSRSSQTSATTAAQTALLEKVRQELQSGDPATLAARLQADGISAATIRAALDARRASTLATATETSAPLSPAERAARARARALERPLTDAERAQYGDISREKLLQIQRINSDYNDLGREIRAKASGTLIPEDREKLTYLEHAKLADLARVLTSQEFEDYQLRTSATASSLRYLRDQAVGFRASEEEFRAIYRATAAADSQSSDLVAAGTLTAADAARQKQAAIDAQLQSTLSPERFADYKRATDPAYQPINRLVTRLDLPAATSDQVVALQTDIKQRAATIRSNTKVPVPMRNEQLAALAQEATATLSATLTPRGFEAYQADPSSAWLKNLAPRPATPAPPAKPKS